MPDVDTVKLRAELSEVVNRVAYGKERMTLTRRGKAVAVLMPLEDARLLEQLEDEADIRDSKKALLEKGGITLDQMKKELGL